MTPALKHFDLILGVDIHIVQPPGPVPPVPIPHPYVGIIFSAMDYLPVIGSTVKVNGLPAARAGSPGQSLVPHVPLGGVFVKPPTNESEVFMGSATVLADGSPMAFLGVPVLTCQDIGMPAPSRAGKSPAKSMMLPSGIAISIPSGPPVMVGGPPIVNVSAHGTMERLAGGAMLGMLKKAASKAKRPMGRVLKAASERAHQFAGAAMKRLGVGERARNAVHRAICTFTGHPVDVASGKLLVEAVDFEVEGLMPLVFERSWYSTSVHEGPLGYGWHHSYDLALLETERAVVVRLEDGRAVAFPPVKAGAEYFDRKEKLTLARDDEGYSMTDRKGLVWRFPARGLEVVSQVESLKDRGRHCINFLYDEEGRLDRLIDSGARTFKFTHDERGRIAAVAGPHPSEPKKRLTLMQYAYDEAGNLVAAIDALGHATRFEYQGHLLVKETNRNGLSFRFEYDGTDEKARCIHTWGDGGLYNHTLRYDVLVGITEVQDSLGHTTVYHHHDGAVFKRVDALGNTTGVERNDFREPVVETDALGQVTLREYDDRGNEVKTLEPGGAVTRTTYEKDLPVAVVDSLGVTWRFEYDEKGQLSRRTDALGRSTEFLYDDFAFVGVVAPDGHETKLRYDHEGNLLEATTPDGEATKWEYDGLGRVIREVDARENASEFSYDALGRLVEMKEPDGNVRHLEYDGENNVLYAKDMLREIHFRYQGMGKLVSREETWARVEFRYDTEERLTGIRNEKGHLYEFVLGPTGEVDVEMGFDGVRRAYKRDKAGRVVEVQREGEATTKYVHDGAGRVLAVAQGDASSDWYTYRADGEIVEAKNGMTTVSLERDELGRVVKETQGQHWVASEYDVNGQRVKVKSSLGASQVIERGPMGDVRGVRAGGLRAIFKRDELGLEVEREVELKRSAKEDGFNGLRWLWERDCFGRPLMLQRGYRGVAVSERRYYWGIGDRIQGISHRIPMWTQETQYSHDHEGNLRAAMYESPRTGQVETELRAPDMVGNLFETESRKDRDYGPAGQLLMIRDSEGDATQYVYDEEGNLIARVEPNGKEWKFEWNKAGLLVKVVRADRGVVEFGYDALGRRMWKKYRGRVTRWVWDGNNPLHEWVEDETPTRVKKVAPPRKEEGTKEAPITWLFEPESFAPMGKLVGEAVYAVVTDHLGTPIAMCDAKCNQSWAAELGIWGQVRTLQGEREACPFRWPGQYEDVETGLYYNRFRYYDPKAGQYISQDPIGLEGGLRIYAYVADPTTWVDTFGLSGCGSPKTRARALREAKDRLGVPRSQQPTRIWTVHDPGRVRGPGVRHPSPRHQGYVYEYKVPTRVGMKNVCIADHRRDPFHGGTGHAHTGLPKPGSASVDPGARYMGFGDPIVYTE